MQTSEETAVAVSGGSPIVDRTERRRQAWRRIVVRQVTRLRERADGSDPAARDAAARAGRLAALLELEENGSLSAAR